MAIGLVLAPGVALAQRSPAPRARTSPSPSPGEGDGSRTSPGVVLVFGLLAAAIVWQVQRGRRSTREYARDLESHFERSLKPNEQEDVRAEEPHREKDDSG